ncbi:MAG: TonB C-terminal domain-containing protein [Acidobacteria bacterium]|nr:TonB C-terminal domain-containing protein [Acidobacteriota bacterium]
MPETTRVTMLDIPLLEERYGRTLLASAVLHVVSITGMILLPRILPPPAALLIGSGPGGGTGGESYTVGIADEPSGGAGMFKPSIIPQPPALEVQQPDQAAPQKQPVALPDIPKEKKQAPAKGTSAVEKKTPPSSMVVPTEPRPGSGGAGGISSGSGGGRGGGSGVLIGSGSGGFGDSWYARAVEARISSNWIRPAPGVRVEIAYSFSIAPDGAIFDIKREKSSGNEALDLTAERAIRASNPLAPPPPHLRGRPLKFLAEFIYPLGP